MAIPTIHVGCTHFARGRLQALVNCDGLYPVACVDINLDEAQEGVGSLEGDTPEGLGDRIYTTITEARAKHDAEVCLIYASTPVHAKLVIESLNLGLHTLCVKPIATTPDEFREIIKVRKAHPDLMLVQGQNKRWNPAASRMREWLRGSGWYRRNAWRGVSILDSSKSSASG